MSNFCNYEMAPLLFDEILQKHWDYLDAEETLAKFEMRKELEKRLQDYLCMIPHEKKFFLVETALVLKRSITQNNDFSAYKAVNGFESISQYANNLFTKPWRKEYKVIKMYSGFYQHEIKANLEDSEKLFEAMGYKLMPNQTLVLEGAICPDQVTNVARDAMAAMVECEIMKQIYSGLTAKQLSSSWIEIFNFREKHIGTIPEMVRAMAVQIQEKQHQRKNKILTQDNCYHTQHTAPCNSCSLYQCMPNITQQSNHYYNPQLLPISQSSYHHGPPPCSIHPHQQQYGTYGPAQLPTTIPHSKSLDYYDPVLHHSGGYPNNQHHHPAGHPHRHSVDQPAFDYNQPLQQNYDCTDGTDHHQCGNTSFNHPYNVSGNRVPLPYDLGTSYPPQHLPPPPLPPQSTYYSRLQHPAPTFAEKHQFNGSVNNVDYYCPVMNPNQQMYLQNNVTSPMVPMDKLIDFEQQQQQQPNRMINRNNGYYGKQDKEHQSDDYLPPPLFAKNSKSTTRTSDKHMKTNVCIENNYSQQYSANEKGMKNLNLSDFDSFEDENLSNQPPRNKNTDGIGNYESWNYVFRNLEQQGYSKDLDQEDDTGEDQDENEGIQMVGNKQRRLSQSRKNATALVNLQQKSHEFNSATKPNLQSTTTNDMSINGRPMSSVQRHDNNKPAIQPKVQSNKINIGTMTSTSSSTKLEKNSNVCQQPLVLSKVGVNKQASNHQQPSTIANTNHQTNVNNNNNVSNNITSNNLNGQSDSRKKTATAKSNGKISTSTGSNSISNSNYCVAKKANGTVSAGLCTSVDSNHVSANISSGAVIAEWSCQFCTYLNPINLRICEMCAKSRDFNLEGSKNKATCV